MSVRFQANVHGQCRPALRGRCNHAPSCACRPALCGRRFGREHIRRGRSPGLQRDMLIAGWPSAAGAGEVPENNPLPPPDRMAGRLARRDGNRGSKTNAASSGGEHVSRHPPFFGRHLSPTCQSPLVRINLRGYSEACYDEFMLHVRSSSKAQPRCIVIAGPNGAGKTTFAREFLPRDAGVIHFVNADLIAAGLSPLDPGLARLAAGRLVLRELDRLSRARASFAFETTMSGRGYLSRIKRWKAAGYRVEIVFLRLDSPSLALRRIAARVRQGGHDVPRSDVFRRIRRGADLFPLYRAVSDTWAVYDNSGPIPRLLEKFP